VHRCFTSPACGFADNEVQWRIELNAIVDHWYKQDL
jgi:hypothetical protein